MSSRNHTLPTLVHSDNHHGDEYTHNAFGVISVTHPQLSGGVRLFGSKLKHTQCVTIHIDTAKLIKRHGYEDVMADKHILELDMTELQWAQFVSSSMGRNIPVTLSEYRSEGWISADQIDIEDTVAEKFSSEMSKSVKESIAQLKELSESLQSLVEATGSVSKKELKELSFNLKNRVDNLPSNLGYVSTVFQKEIDKTMEASKQEIEAFIENTATRLGMEEIRKMNPMLQNSSINDQKVIDSN
jgi:ElaB/YqjD/DUF883 family membrane-anchored ribosome-binding protein